MRATVECTGSTFKKKYYYSVPEKLAIFSLVIQGVVVFILCKPSTNSTEAWLACAKLKYIDEH